MQPDSLLYAERAVVDHPHGRTLLERFGPRRVVYVDSYKEIFARPAGDFRAQKRTHALVAAVGSPPYLYETPARACGVDDVPVHYNGQLRNCVYDCDYCFLQGMHPSGYTLVYVNSADFHRAAAERAAVGDYWLSISYLSDIMGFERTLPLVREWLDFAREHPGVTLEIRTKGATSAVIRTPPVANAVLIWTISPREVAAQHERGCPGLDTRLDAVCDAIARGWRVRLAFDPVLIVPGWTAAYAAMLAEVFDRVDVDAVESVTYGVFRMGADFMTRISAARADTPLLHHPFTRTDGLVTYAPAEIDTIDRVVGDRLRRMLGENRVTFVHG